jgi:tRNA(Ile)-lysidine synthase
MEGKSKKVSKLLKTQIIIIRKENIWILWSGNTIVWVVSLRQGEQFRVDSKTQNIKNRVRIMKNY